MSHYGFSNILFLKSEREWRNEYEKSIAEILLRHRRIDWRLSTNATPFSIHFSIDPLSMLRYPLEE